MRQSLVLMSGPIAVGKSVIANVLIKHHGFVGIRSGTYLKGLATTQGKGHSRAELQELGDDLDNKTDYAWLINDVVVSALGDAPKQDRWLLDSVRKKRQVEHFRALYGTAVLHVHFTAPEDILRERYEKRIAAGGEYAGNTPYSIAAVHSNEVSARGLIEFADLTIDLLRTGSDEAAIAIVEKCTERARLCVKS